ncbi:MFS transporter [Acidithiobacillus sp. IBUN Pt1247-S3]|uniref:MFS transporter n=1 Tax=Acidithiobacillus sp. IBUN Pt1247-S3 TaxID=3166642 RepID=UPI0034E576D6
MSLLAAAAFVVLFAAGGYLPLVPYISGGVGVNTLYGMWGQADFFAAMGIAFLLLPELERVLGERYSLALALATVVITAVLAATASTLAQLLPARVLMGWGAGTALPLALRQFQRLIHGPGGQGQRLAWSYLGMTPFFLAPLLAGALIRYGHWPVFFWLEALVAAVAVGGLWCFPVAGAPQRASGHTTDLPALLLLVLGIGVLQAVADSGQILDWWRASAIRMGLMLALGVALLLLGRGLWTRRSPLPAVLLRSPRFCVAGLGVLLATAVLQGLFALFLVQYQVLLGYSTWQVGLLFIGMAPTVLLGLLGSAWWLRRAYSSRLLLVLCLGGTALSAVWVAHYARDATPTSLIWPPLFFGLFLGGFFSGFMDLGSRAAAVLGHEADANRWLNALRTLGQGLGIPLVTSLWLRREDLYHHFLAELPAGSRAAYQTVLQTLGTQGLSHPAAAQVMAGEYQRLAGMLAFNEVFAEAAGVFGLLALGLLVWVLVDSAVSPWAREIRHH